MQQNKTQKGVKQPSSTTSTGRQDYNTILLALAYVQQKQTASSHPAPPKEKKLSKKQKQIQSEMTRLVNSANTLIEGKQYNLALNNYQKAVTLAEEHDFSVLALKYRIRLGELGILTHDWQLVKKQADELLPLVKSKTILADCLPSDICAAYQFIVCRYLQLGCFKEAQAVVAIFPDIQAIKVGLNRLRLLTETLAPYASDTSRITAAPLPAKNKLLENILMTIAIACMQYMTQENWGEFTRVYRRSIQQVDLFDDPELSLLKTNLQINLLNGMLETFQKFSPEKDSIALELFSDALATAQAQENNDLIYKSAYLYAEITAKQLPGINVSRVLTDYAKFAIVRFTEAKSYLNKKKQDQVFTAVEVDTNDRVNERLLQLIDEPMLFKQLIADCEQVNSLCISQKNCGFNARIDQLRNMGYSAMQENPIYKTRAWGNLEVQMQECTKELSEKYLSIAKVLNSFSENIIEAVFENLYPQLNQVDKIEDLMGFIQELFRLIIVLVEDVEKMVQAVQLCLMQMSDKNDNVNRVAATRQHIPQTMRTYVDIYPNLNLRLNEELVSKFIIHDLNLARIANYCLSLLDSLSASYKYLQGLRCVQLSHQSMVDYNYQSAYDLLLDAKESFAQIHDTYNLAITEQQLAALAYFKAEQYRSDANYPNYLEQYLSHAKAALQAWQVILPNSEENSQFINYLKEGIAATEAHLQETSHKCLLKLQ